MSLTKQAAIENLRKLIGKVQLMEAKGLDSEAAALKTWKRVAENTLRNIFGDDSPQFRDLSQIKFYRPDRRSTSPQQDFEDGINDAILLIQGMIDEVEEDWNGETLNERTDKTTESQTKARSAESSATLIKPCVFIGHGRNPLWARLQLFLANKLGLETVNYESESRVGESIVPLLEKMLSQATFAVLILTAEDETTSGVKRARQNVIHEAGLFQGKLGFKKAILLRQEGTEDFSNVAGLQYISFTGDKLEQTFWELQEVLKRENQLP